VARPEDEPVEAGEATGEGELEVAAGEVLLQQADDEEAEQPERAVVEGVVAVEEDAVDDEQAGLPQDDDEQREADGAPGEAGEEEAGLAASAEAVDGGGAGLDLRHDPGDEDGDEEGNGLDGDHAQGREGLRGLALDRMRGKQVRLVADGSGEGEQS